MQNSIKPRELLHQRTSGDISVIANEVLIGAERIPGKPTVERDVKIKLQPQEKISLPQKPKKPKRETYFKKCPKCGKDVRLTVGREENSWSKHYGRWCVSKVASSSPTLALKSTFDLFTFLKTAPEDVILAFKGSKLKRVIINHRGGVSKR